jgi:tRNA G18 (ribose-2'-O)-methylase SpoU
MIIPVAAADDPRLAPYQTLKDYEVARDTDGFIVEGAIALERLIETGRYPLVSVFLSERAAERLAPLLARVGSDVPVYVAPQPAMDEVVGYHIHRGVLALARRQTDHGAAHLLAQLGDAPLTVLVVIGLSNHDNVGACFRNAAALGADAVLLDSSSCDPLYRKAIRVSSGAALSLPFAHGGTGEELVTLLHAHKVDCWAMTPSGADTLASLAPPPRLALVLGPEGPGLPETVMQACRRVSIPTAGGMDSLNVATAGAIALAHVAARRAG